MNRTVFNPIFKTGLKGLFFLVISITLGRHAIAQPDLQNPLDPKVLYDRMQSSTEAYNYSGILTYEQGGQLQSFSVSSSTEIGQVEQKLSLLDGPLSSHHFSFDASCDRPSLPASDELGFYYNFYSRGDERVAGREGVEIVLAPVDKYRNGYQYVIDAETGLMLRSVTLTPDRRMIERLQFVQLDYELSSELSGESPDGPAEETIIEFDAQDSALAEEMDINDATAIQALSQEETIAEELATDRLSRVGCSQLSIENGWSSGWLPEGFSLRNSSLEEEKAVLVYSDGLSTFSVFIETALDVFIPPSSAQRGATTVYMNYLSDQSSSYLVSVVGEIPIATAERVLASLVRN